jgi:hypothetical protein
MSADTVPSAAFESLLPKMITILQTAQNPEGVVSPEVKRALLHAVSVEAKFYTVRFLTRLY